MMKSTRAKQQQNQLGKKIFNKIQTGVGKPVFKPQFVQERVQLYFVDTPLDAVQKQIYHKYKTEHPELFLSGQKASEPSVGNQSNRFQRSFSQEQGIEGQNRMNEGSSMVSSQQRVGKLQEQVKKLQEVCLSSQSMLAKLENICYGIRDEGKQGLAKVISKNQKMNKNIEILGQGLYEVKESIDQSNSRDIQSEMGEKVANNILQTLKSQIVKTIDLKLKEMKQIMLTGRQLQRPNTSQGECNKNQLKQSGYKFVKRTSQRLSNSPLHSQIEYSHPENSQMLSSQTCSYTFPPMINHAKSQTYQSYIEVSRGSQKLENNSSFLVSPILYKRQSDRMFLINQINAFHGNQLLLNSTELLFKKDRYQKDLVIYFTEAEDIPFVVLMKTNRGHVFGGYSEGLCTAQDTRFRSFLFSITNQMVFFPEAKDPKMRTISVAYKQGYLVYGNNQLKIKNNQLTKVQLDTSMFGDKYFQIPNMEGLTGEDETEVYILEIELHRVCLVQNRRVMIREEE